VQPARIATPKQMRLEKEFVIPMFVMVMFSLADFIKTKDVQHVKAERAVVNLVVV
jgi:hypothetical protein